MTPVTLKKEACRPEVCLGYRENSRLSWVIWSPCFKSKNEARDVAPQQNTCLVCVRSSLHSVPGLGRQCGGVGGRGRIKLKTSKREADHSLPDIQSVGTLI